jgi:hypothetical protein
MNKKEIALIIPIHPPKFHFIYNLIKKINIINKCCDIVLVFSNKEDYNEFIHKDKIEPIILKSDNNTENIVTFKKFTALNILKDSYSYYIVCDSEIDIIDNNFTYENIMMKINEFYNSKKIFSGKFRLNQNKVQEEITRTSCNIFKTEDDQNKLKTLSNDYKLFYWWSDLPVYKASHLSDFFHKINFDMDLTWYHFDHKIYLNYLVLYHNFEFINIEPIIGINWSLESYRDNNINNLEILKKHSYTFSWIDHRLFNKHKDYLTKNGSFLLYHLDRYRKRRKRRK